MAVALSSRSLLEETCCQILHVQREFLHDNDLKASADSGIEYAVAMVNEARQAARYFNAGAQSILSDIPDLFGPHVQTGGLSA